MSECVVDGFLFVAVDGRLAGQCDTDASTCRIFFEEGEFQKVRNAQLRDQLLVAFVDEGE